MSKKKVLTGDELREADAKKNVLDREYIDDFERLAEEYDDEQVEPDDLQPPVESGGGKNGC